MNYSFKVTTAGRELLATLLATGQVLELTRVAVGSGRVAEDTNLADMTDLVQYVAEGTLTQRNHQDNILYLTVQYASNSTPGLGAFYLSEFIVQAKHPDTGENVTFLYATLGDYIQHVNAYSEELPPDIRNYPMMIAISDEINVSVTAPVGLVTYDELEQACEDLRNTLVSRTLLWQNGSQSGIFPEQLVEIPIAGYDAFDVMFINSLDNRFVTTQRIEQKRVYDASVYYRLSMMYESKQYYRDFTLDNSGFNFGQGAILQPSSSPTYSNGYIIPLRIYGIKGVQ